jgi:histidine ammonia-lyase
MTERPLMIDGGSLTLEDVEAVSRGGPLRPMLGERARERMRATRAVVEDILEGDAAVYGINTGFGKLSDVRVSPERLRELQLNLVRSHACGVGEPLAREEVRAMMLLRANVLASGRSGVRPELVDLLLELLHRDVTPVVPREGSVGASGDLAPAAHMALVLVGEGEATVGAERLRGGEALSRADLEPARLEAKEGLALLNGTQAMTAVGTLTLLRAEALADAAELAGAASLEGLRGTPDPFSEEIQALRPHPGQRISAGRLRSLLRDSEIRESHRYGDSRVQDAYSLRCMPQVHGTTRDSLAFVRRVLEVEVNAATDNPLVTGADGSYRLLSNGNFHGQPVAAAADQLTVAACTLATISERRTDRLLNPDLSGLPAFLTPEPGLRSGMMMLQVTAAAQVATCRQLAAPASVGTIPTGAAKEDHVSMGMHAADKARSAVDCLERILAIELLAAAQALHLLRPLRPGVGVEEGMALIRERIPPLDEDRPLAPDIRTVVGLLRDGSLADVVRRHAGTVRGL